MTTPTPLTPEEQAAYDEYILANPNSGKTILEGMSPVALKAFLAERISANNPTQIVAPVFQSGSTTPTDTTFSQQPYGVSGNRQASKATGLPIAGSYTGFKISQPSDAGRRGIDPSIEPRYFDGDEDLLNTLSREDVMTIQTGMKQAGILGKFRLGVVDEATSTAFIKVLGQSNKIGGDYMQGLKLLQQAGPASDDGSGGGLGRRVSNPDDLGKVIDNSAGLVLGRKVDPAMKQRLVQAYQMLERQNTAPDAGVFAEKKIGQQNSAEADAYKFAQYAQVFEKLLGQ